jgi:hypothetical protein
VRPRQHLPPRSLGEQQRARPVYITLTLHKSHTQFPVGTSEKRPPGDSRRACRRDLTQGTKVPHDGPAEVPVRLDAGRHKGVTGVQMASMCPVLAQVSQSGSGAAHLGGGGSAGRAVRMNHGDIYQGGSIGRGKGHLNVGARSLKADCCNANGSVAGLRTRIAARAGGYAAESFLPVVVPTRAAPSEAIATHGLVDVAALDVTTTKASGNGDMRIGAGCTKAEVATVMSRRQRGRDTGSLGWCPGKPERAGT